jgi:hypothetical protein
MQGLVEHLDRASILKAVAFKVIFCFCFFFLKDVQRRPARRASLAAL